MQPTNHPSPVDQIARALLVAMLCAAPALVCFRTAAGACVADPDVPDWATDPDLKSAGVVIAPVDTALAQLLHMDSRFELAYQDKIADVFVARSQPQKSSGRR